MKLTVPSLSTFRAIGDSFGSFVKISRKRQAQPREETSVLTTLESVTAKYFP